MFFTGSRDVLAISRSSYFLYKAARFFTIWREFCSVEINVPSLLRDSSFAASVHRGIFLKEKNFLIGCVSHR